MALTKITARQSPVTALVAIGPANMGTDNGVTLRLPQGAYVTDVKAVGTVAFDSGTTATMTVGDGTTTFVNAQSIAAAGAVTVAVGQKFYPTGGTITVSAAQTGDDATVGQALVAVQYVELGRWSENQD